MTTTLPTSPTPMVETTSYGYDALNRLSTVTDNALQVTSYTYDNVGNRATVTYPNGNITTYSYDTLNRLTHQDTQDATTTVIARFDYTLTPSGRRSQVVELSGATTSYSYDDLYRLTGEDLTSHPVLGSVSNSYSYDPVGNRVASIENGVSTAYTYDANDRLLTAGGESYTYDANGNTLTVAIDTTLTTNTYDVANRLSHMVKTVNGTPTDDVSYQYDIDGIRTAKNDDGVITNFVVDKNRDYAQVLNEVDATNNPQVSYVYGDDLIKQSRAANDSFYLYDGLGSTRALTNSTGTITDTYDYSAYGTEIDSTGTTVNNYKFTGEQFDQNLNNYYLRARYYDPSVGRFTQMDSYQGRNNDPVTLHKYAYGNGDPVNMVDPSGHFGLAEFSVANNIQVTLSEMQIDVGTSLLDVALDPNSASGNLMLGGLVSLGGAAAFKILSKLSKKFRQLCNSFSDDTLVSTESGLKSISEVVIGEKVWAFDEETGEISLQDVTHLIQREGEKEIVEITLDTGDVIHATAGHPFYVKIGEKWEWITAGDLKSGMLLRNEQGLERTISRIKTSQKTTKVYNLTVANDHTYFVGDDKVLAHNARTCRMPEVHSGSASGMTGARQMARREAKLGDDAVPYLAERPSRTRGAVYSGMQSPDGKRGWRIDYDSEKGLHVNWWRTEEGVEWKGYVDIPGASENDYWEILSHFPWRI